MIVISVGVCSQFGPIKPVKSAKPVKNAKSVKPVKSIKQIANAKAANSNADFST